MPQLSFLTPLGDITISEDEGSIIALDWGRGRDQDETPLLREARAQVQDFFDGRRMTFTLPLTLNGTAFRRRVWQAMRSIPAGQTRSYGDVARDLGSAARAVGGACGANPIPILVPCHRIIGEHGKVGGYSGGEGPATKRILLALEAAAVSKGIASR